MITAFWMGTCLVSEIIPIFEDSGQRGAGALRGGQEARVMMMLGNFAFSIDTAAYHQLTRESQLALE